MSQLPPISCLKFLEANRDLPLTLKGLNLEVDLSALRRPKEEEKQPLPSSCQPALFGAAQTLNSELLHRQLQIPKKQVFTSIQSRLSSDEPFQFEQVSEEESDYNESEESASAYSSPGSPRNSKSRKESRHSNQYTKKSFFALKSMEGSKTRYEIIYKNILKEIRRFALKTLGLKQKNRKKLRSEISERIVPSAENVQEFLEESKSEFTEKSYWVIQCLCDTKFHKSLKEEAGEDEFKNHVFDQTFLVMEKFNLISLEHFLEMPAIKEIFFLYRSKMGMKNLKSRPAFQRNPEAYKEAFEKLFRYYEDHSADRM